MHKDMERKRNRSRGQTANRQIVEVVGASKQNSQRRDNGCLTSRSPEEFSWWYKVAVGEGQKVKTYPAGILRNYVLLISNMAFSF